MTIKKKQTIIIATILQIFIWQSVFAMDMMKMRQKIEEQASNPQFKLDEKWAITGFENGPNGSGKLSIVDRFGVAQDMLIAGDKYSYGPTYTAQDFDNKKFNIMFQQRANVLDEIYRRKPIAINFDATGSEYKTTNLGLNGVREIRSLIRK